MRSIAMEFFLDASPGALVELPHAGSGLEHPLVFDVAAREILRLAGTGRVQIVQERQVRVRGETLISELRFRRVS